MKKNITISIGSVFVVLSLTVITVATVKLKQNQSTAENKSLASEIVEESPYFTEYINQLAPGFPELPIYPGAILSRSRRESKAIDFLNGYSSIWTLKPESDVYKIANWYTDELNQHGWKKSIDSQDNGPDNQILKFSKLGQSIIINIERGKSSDPNEVEILVIILKNEL